MRWKLALALSVALCAHASAGPDPSQACRDAWAERESCKRKLADAFGAGDTAAIARIENEFDAATRRFRAAFASVSFDAWRAEEDGPLLDIGLRCFVEDARARGDLLSARRALDAFVAKRRSAFAFEARSLSLPELDLAAGNVDAALTGFRIGALQLRPHPARSDAAPGFTVRLRIGDVLAACGDVAAARAEYASARKTLDAAKSDPMSEFMRKRSDAELEVRDLVGKPLPALPRTLGIDDESTGARGVLVLYFGRVGLRGDAGRLRELDRLGDEQPAGKVGVRIFATGDRVGGRERGRGGFVVRVPSGPDDADGEEVAFDGKDVAGLVARIRGTSRIRRPVAVVESSGALPAPFDREALVLVVDRARNVVHASVAGDFVDWICGIARIVAAGTKPTAAPATRSAQTDQAQRDVCARNLTALSAPFPEYVTGRYMMTGRRALDRVGARLLFDLFGQTSDRPLDVRRLLCPADASALFPTTAADAYLWDEADVDHPPPELCSYAGRDFVAHPPAAGDARAILAGCLHHRGGALVARIDGTVEFVTLKDLGVASDDEKTVGPESKSPVLRVLR